jgi:hypothetical protein
MAKGQQALYQQLLTSEIFTDQASAIQWGNEQKKNYEAGGMVVKVDVTPSDATRRRWVAQIFLKV